MRSDLPTGTVTFLFTDVEGSTRLLEEIGDEAYDEALAEHRRIVREACTEHAGVEVDTQGDAFFFAFSTAPAALAAASAMTTALAPGPIRVRIGLHTGEPHVSDEGYVGKEVHFAARVAATGHGGQIVISKATAELVEVQLSDLGEHRLKDIAEAVAIYQLGSERFPPLKTISNTNLPRPASSFVGRELELAEVLARIDKGARLLTLTGPGGSGKTRLALEAATTLVPEYKAGVFWVGLAALRDYALVSEQISQTLGAKDGLAEHIGEREMLLLIDNLEHVIAAAPELSQLLQGCPNLTVLCTSRELLRVQGEVEYPVPPLASPEAVSLFCERAQLEPNDEIAMLCIRLDSLPLAVELAAARTKALSIAQILERLSQRLDLLRGGRDADPRQQTLRATIAWSYDLLLLEEQRLFTRLSVFAGGCALKSAEEVCDADLDTLQSLVEKSLLRFSNERYWMLETIREYARERLEQAGEGEGSRRSHAEHFLSFAEEAGPGTEGGDEQEQEEWLNRLELENDNLRAAGAFFAEEGDADCLLRLATSLWNFRWCRGYLEEGRRALAEALEATEDSHPLRLRALVGASHLSYFLNDGVAARGYAEQLLKIATESQDNWGIGLSYNLLANSEFTHRGDVSAARALYEQSVAHLGDDPAARWALGALGAIAFEEGDEHATTRAYLERSLGLAEVVGDRQQASHVLAYLGALEMYDGDEAVAYALLRRSLETSRSLGDEAMVARRALPGFAAFVAQTEPFAAAKLFGAIDGILERHGGTQGPFGTKLHAEAVLIVRRALSPDAFDQARVEGRTMELDDIIALAYAAGEAAVSVA